MQAGIQYTVYAWFFVVSRLNVRRQGMIEELQYTSLLARLRKRIVTKTEGTIIVVKVGYLASGAD